MKRSLKVDEGSLSGINTLDVLHIVTESPMTASGDATSASIKTFLSTLMDAMKFLDGSIEDNDLSIRVLNQEKQIRSVRGIAIIFHL